MLVKVMGNKLTIDSVLKWVDVKGQPRLVRYERFNAAVPYYTVALVSQGEHYVALLPYRCGKEVRWMAKEYYPFDKSGLQLWRSKLRSTPQKALTEAVERLW